MSGKNRPEDIFGVRVFGKFLFRFICIFKDFLARLIPYLFNLRSIKMAKKIRVIYVSKILFQIPRLSVHTERNVTSRHVTERNVISPAQKIALLQSFGYPCVVRSLL